MNNGECVNKAPAFDAGAALAALRERGRDRADPVRFRFIEAMARRAGAHGGDARRMLDERIAQLLAAYGDALTDRPEAAAASAPRRNKNRPSTARSPSWSSTSPSTHRRPPRACPPAAPRPS
jgi:hypothetical protein